MSDHPDATTGHGSGTHPSDAELHAHLEGALDPDADQRVAGHLDDCADCIARLDDFASAPALAPTPHETLGWDERSMRRSIRRTLLRTAFNAAALLVVGVIALQFLGQLVLQPLLVDRGDRVQRHVLATHDLPLLTTPGAELAQIVSNPDIIRRTTEVEVQRAVGAGTVPLGWLTSRLGPLGISMPHGGFVSPSYAGLHARDGSRFGDRDDDTVPFEPERLADGTAVTVHLIFGEAPVSQAEAQTLADEAEGVALLWVGFLVPGADPADHWSWQLGYSACGAPAEFLVETSERGIGGFGGSGFRTFDGEGDGVQDALAQVRRATANLAAAGWPPDDDTTDDAFSDLDTTAAAFVDGQPDVTSLVVTGPTAAVSAVVREAEPSEANLLEVDFDRGAPLPCG